jgi:FkbM family methyltransferase
MLLRLLRNAIYPAKSRRVSFLKLVPGLIHVGAHAAEERTLYDDAGLSVVWVEPIPEIFARLVENIRPYPRQRALQYLVTDRDGADYEFHVSNNDGYSSSIFELALHRDIWPHVQHTRTIRMKSITLASLVRKESIDISKYPGLVLDTQGAELLVLKGAGDLLSSFRYIQAEAAEFEAYEGGCQLDDIALFLREQGFDESSRTEFAEHAGGGSYCDVLYERRT